MSQDYVEYVSKILGKLNVKRQSNEVLNIANDAKKSARLGDFNSACLIS